MSPNTSVRSTVLAAVLGPVVAVIAAWAAILNGPIPGPLPIFPHDHWWNLDVSSAPVDASSASYIAFINNGSTRRLHPDFGGEASPGSVEIFRAMQRYGLIVPDNGSDMYVSGTFDPRWNNDVLNPAFRSLTASDFEVIALGYRPPMPPSNLRITPGS